MKRSTTPSFVLELPLAVAPGQERANDFAEAQGYEPALAYDENDSAGRAMLGFFDWQTASSVSLA
ncbi:hypothetical protein L9S41_19195 [Geoalkalibacter halelectricus]|uniref:Uncharacterized protein n=1 Tax=Geoalkalibacter halelectricus TaxID=2847045 RepID=A0ABY5ZMC0_9BACT|nr:hypothetical protein [Geoalkalibacter halelectricus]UWZ79778.1 hypothetical protein L9S41_19195 [Geoalkalibacter halelectricus]